MEKINSLLHKIFDLQMGLVRHYMVIENLPQPPVDLDSRQGQRIIKDFTNRTIEELAESYSTINELLEAVESNAGPEELNELLVRYNEELADALHFMVETLLFVGLEASGIDRHFYELSKGDPDLYRNIYCPGDPLGSLIKQAKFMNWKDNVSFDNCVKPSSFRVPWESLSSELNIIAGGRVIGRDIIPIHCNFLWSVTYKLKLATNLLKNRDWSQTEKITNRTAFYEGIMECLGIFIRYLEFTGHNKQSIYSIYERKNSINLKRIKDGY